MMRQKMERTIEGKFKSTHRCCNKCEDNSQVPKEKEEVL